MRAGWFGAVVLVACTTSRGSYVSTLAVVGDHLSVEQCTIYTSGDVSGTTGCVTKDVTFPRPTLGTAGPRADANDHDACVEERARIGRAAQEVQDRGERARLLRSMPECSAAKGNP